MWNIIISFHKENKYKIKLSYYCYLNQIEYFTILWHSILEW